MMIDESEKAFDAWWANQNQTIGKVAAKLAWDYQQATMGTMSEGKPPYVKPTIKVLEVVSDTPDRIWIDRHCWDTQESNIFDTEYIRFELVAAAIKAIKGEG